MKFAILFFLGMIFGAGQLADAVRGSRTKRELCSREMVQNVIRRQEGILMYPVIRALIGHSTNVNRKRTNPPGCKFPFHNGAFTCCRRNGGDCSKYHIDTMRKSARSFKKCMYQRRYGYNYIKCWIDAEKENACKYSAFGHYWMRKFNNGKTW